jgi:hypothetical protein
MLLMTSVAACVSAGSVKLSENDFKKVIEGKSSKDEVAGVLGRPEQSLKLDKISLDTYINRVLSTEVPKDMFPEDQYEVWAYNKWSYFAVDPLLIPSHESTKISLLIFNSSGICIKKFYDEEGRFKF